jgi:hypothetical protein
LLVLLVPCGHAQAQAQNETPPPMPLDQQEQLERLQKFKDSANALLNQVDVMTASKKNQCMKAFGNTEFCECIAEKSPVAITFVGYVSIVAGTKEDLKYDQLSPDDKKLFDATRAARDECVNWKGKSDKLKPATN